MISTLHRFIGICLLASPLTGLASTHSTDENKHSIEAQLKALVHEGMTIDEAVAQSITATPYSGEKITKTALSIYKGLPKRACATRAKDGGMRFTIWPDFKACSNRIVHAAIEAGADPNEVTPASAAGLPKDDQSNHSLKSVSNKNTRKTAGIDLYVLRQFLLGSTN